MTVKLSGQCLIIIKVNIRHAAAIIIIVASLDTIDLFFEGKGPAKLEYIGFVTLFANRSAVM